MTEIIPAIIAKDFKELREKILKIQPHTRWIQLDIMDGDFVPNTTWNNPVQLKTMDFSILFEAHLMISQPEKYIEQWIEAGVKRILVHIEAARKSKVQEMREKCRNKRVEFGIALNPETPTSVLDGIIHQLNLVLFLAVSPGFGGEKFREEILSKIRTFRKQYPYVKIEVDGGINPESGKKCIEAGANILVSGSYIFKSDNLQKAIEELKNV